jgi:septal ring-binding cell division protein DamX
MHRDSEKMSSALLQAGNDLDNFFAGGGRGKLLSELQESVLEGVPLLIITGEDGSGKTTICRAVEQKMAAECVVVNFPQTVESFEDVIRIIGHKLGIATVEITDGKELRGAIGKIVESLLEDRSHLLIIFDEAENIYLATLERIRKMLGQMTDAGVYLHVLFSGKPSFLENYDQLIICDFKQVEEFHSVLSPLTEAETSEYLQSCGDYFSVGDDTVEALSLDRAVTKIDAIAKGNFGMIRIAAEDYIAALSGTGSFSGGVGKIPAEAGESDAGWQDFIAGIDIKRFLPFLPWVGGSLSILLVLLLVFGSGDKHGDDKEVPRGEIPVEAVKDEPVVTVEEEVADVPVLPEEGAVTPGEEDTVPMVREKVEDDDATGTGAVVSIEETASLEDIEPLEPEVEKSTDPGDGVALDSVAVSDQQNEVKNGEIETELVQEKDIIVELRQSPPLKKKVGVSRAVKRNKIVVQPRKEVQKVTAVNKNFTVDQLYSRRIAAGREWRYGVKDNMYTIQLMSLTSKNAEHNLKLMLAQKNYRSQASNFFIFKKNSHPAAIFVYYGEYPTITEARRALKSIPSFLRMHKPYAISVKGAVAKIKK